MANRREQTLSQLKRTTRHDRHVRKNTNRAVLHLCGNRPDALTTAWQLGVVA